MKTGYLAMLLLLALAGCAQPQPPSAADQNGLVADQNNPLGESALPPTASKLGKLALFFRDQNAGDYNLLLAIQSIELQSTKGYWVKLSGARYVDFSRAVDRNVFLGETALPVGKYRTLSIQLAESKARQGGLEESLIAPPNALALSTAVEIASGQESAMQLTVDTNQSMAWRRNGSPNAWVLLPVIRLQSKRGVLLRAAENGYAVVGGIPLENQAQFFDLNANALSEPSWTMFKSGIESVLSTPTAARALKSNEFELDYDENGFSESEITVKRGTPLLKLTIRVSSDNADGMGYNFTSAKNNFESGQVLPGRSISVDFSTINEGFKIESHVAGSDRVKHALYVNAVKDLNRA